ncbi:MAG: heme exporter protein CcmD [Hyphomicrobiales bacterium]
MEHFGFIFASYLVTLVIIGAISIWLVLDYRAQKHALAALEARGVRRRSTKSNQATVKMESGS